MYNFHFQLEAISEMNPVDLRKQMRVEFKGEEGLDEGGLQKELFQLLIEKLLDPMYGEFVMLQCVCFIPVEQLFSFMKLPTFIM